MAYNYRATSPSYYSPTSPSYSPCSPMYSAEIPEDRNYQDVPSMSVTESSSWCRTTSEQDVKHTFVWTIENFSQRSEKFLKSSPFFVEMNDGGVSHWEMTVYPKGIDADSAGYLSAYLDCRTRRMKKVKYTMALKNVDWKTEEQDGYLDIYPGAPLGMAKMLSLRELQEKASTWLPNDALTIVCHLKIQGDEKILSGSNQSNTQVLPAESLKQQLTAHAEKSYLNDDLSDCKLVCGDEVFKCHVFVLAARSPVFHAMFANDHKEAVTRTVKIDNMKPEVVKDMLFNIYTGKSPELYRERAAEQLLDAAEKYQLDELKNLCEQKLILSIYSDNAVDLLILGDMYRAANLKKRAVSYIVENMENVVKTTRWKEMLSSFPELATEVCLAGNQINIKNESAFAI